MRLSPVRSSRPRARRYRQKYRSCSARCHVAGVPWGQLHLGRQLARAEVSKLVRAAGVRGRLCHSGNSIAGSRRDNVTGGSGTKWPPGRYRHPPHRGASPALQIAAEIPVRCAGIGRLEIPSAEPDFILSKLNPRQYCRGGRRDEQQACRVRLRLAKNPNPDRVERQEVLSSAGSTSPSTTIRHQVAILRTL